MLYLTSYHHSTPVDQKENQKPFFSKTTSPVQPIVQPQLTINQSKQEAGVMMKKGVGAKAENNREYTKRSENNSKKVMLGKEEFNERLQRKKLLQKATENTENRSDNTVGEPASSIAERPGKLNLKILYSGSLKGCGALTDWVINWELDRPSINGGYIIQKALRYSEIKDCEENDITLAKTRKRIWVFWEAWRVNPGQKITVAAQGGDTKDDHFSHPERGGRTKGKVMMLGTAKFYEGLNSLPGHFRRNHPDTLARSLPSSTQDPGIIIGGSQPGGRLISYTWDCCQKPSQRTLKRRYKF